MREAIRAARKEFSVCTGPENSFTMFQMGVQATMPVVKELCGLDVVERYVRRRALLAQTLLKQISCRMQVRLSCQCRRLITTVKKNKCLALGSVCIALMYIRVKSN